MFGFLKSLFSSAPKQDPIPTSRFTIDDVARAIGSHVDRLRSVEIAYSTFQIPKRSGGTRTIQAPCKELKEVQRAILHRLLRGLRAHPCATGFERGQSIVTNALPHVDKDVVVRLDLKDFFPSIKADRIKRYFRFIGYDDEAATLLTQLCTYENALPQGGPTSPRLSNLVNFRLDARLAKLAERRGLSYSRYADDITFSANEKLLPNAKPVQAGQSRPPLLKDILHAVRVIIEDEGYRVHTRRKLRISRKHDRQMVTGLVVNERVNLPRATRRRLRAIEHHLRTGQQATLTPEQLQGWHALQAMISKQSIL